MHLDSTLAGVDLILTHIDTYEPKSKPNLVEKGPLGPFSDHNLATFAPAGIPLLTRGAFFDPNLTHFGSILTYFDLF